MGSSIPVGVVDIAAIANALSNKSWAPCRCYRTVNLSMNKSKFPNVCTVDVPRVAFCLLAAVIWNK